MTFASMESHLARSVWQDDSVDEGERCVDITNVID
jgi:hypothetical protein